GGSGAGPLCCCGRTSVLAGAVLAFTSMPSPMSVLIERTPTPCLTSLDVEHAANSSAHAMTPAPRRSSDRRTFGRLLSQAPRDDVETRRVRMPDGQPRQRRDEPQRRWLH